jgi:hypothetical protein
MQVWLTHATGVAQVPVVVHVCCDVVVEHSTVPGEQTPVHAALPTAPVQALLVQAVAVPQVPDAVQVWIVELVAHCVCW